MLPMLHNKSVLELVTYAFNYSVFRQLLIKKGHFGTFPHTKNSPLKEISSASMLKLM